MLEYLGAIGLARLIKPNRSIGAKWDMTTEEIIAYCRAKPGAYLDFPFGEIPICVKVENRLFAQIYPRADDCKLTLNCTIMTGEFYRSLYPDVVVPGYHCPPVQRPYFNTVHLNGTVPDKELKMMIDHSYSTVVGKLPRKIQENLVSRSPTTE